MRLERKWDTRSCRAIITGQVRTLVLFPRVEVVLRLKLVLKCRTVLGIQ